MKINLKLLFLVTFITLTVPFVTAAETVVRTGNSVSVGVNQIVESDFYALAESVSHSGEIKEDMYVAAGSVTINGKVGTDLTVLGGAVQVHSSVGDDVRVVGGEVVIAGDVGGDIFVLGGALTILPTAKVSGNVYFYGGEANISGVVLGEVMGRAKSIVINNQVGGIDVSAVKLELQDKAVIKNNVSYTSVAELERAAGAVIAGQVIRGASAKEPEGVSPSVSLIFMLTWLFTSLCFFLFFRQPLEKLIGSIRHDIARIGLIGLVGVIAGPVIGIVLVATVLGAWLGVMILLIIVFSFILALVLLPILLGGYLWSLWKKHRRLDIIAVASGILAIVLLTLIPIVGGVMLFVAYVVTLGSIIYLVYQKARSII